MFNWFFFSKKICPTDVIASLGTLCVYAGAGGLPVGIYRTVFRTLDRGRSSFPVCISQHAEAKFLEIENIKARF